MKHDLVPKTSLCHFGPCLFISWAQRVNCAEINISIMPKDTIFYLAMECWQHRC